MSDDPPRSGGSSSEEERRRREAERRRREEERRRRRREDAEDAAEAGADLVDGAGDVADLAGGGVPTPGFGGGGRGGGRCDGFGCDGFGRGGGRSGGGGGCDGCDCNMNLLQVALLPLLGSGAPQRAGRAPGPGSGPAAASRAPRRPGRAPARNGAPVGRGPTWRGFRLSTLLAVLAVVLPDAATGVVAAAIRGYRRRLTRWTPACPGTPSCSEYALTAVTTLGARRGLTAAARRLRTCGSPGRRP